MRHTAAWGRRLFTGLSVGLCFFSCATRSELRWQMFQDITQRKDFTQAAADIKKQPDLYGSTNRFLYNADLGMLYHYAGAGDSSTTYLLRAADTYNELYTKSLSREAAALLTNDHTRAYRGKPYEVVWVNQLNQLNYLLRQQPDEALVEARKTQLLFDEWQRQNADENHYFSDGMFHYITSLVYDLQNQSDDAVISLYHAIRAFQSGPVPLPPALERSAYARLKQSGRDDDILKLNLHAATADSCLDSTGSGQPEIIVVGYAGKGPALAEERWWGNWIKDMALVLHHSADDGSEQTMTLLSPPLPEEGNKRKTQSGTSVFIKVALPTLKTFPSQTAYFTVAGANGAAPQKTMVINDFNVQAARQLDEAKPAIIARTVVRTVLRTLAAQEAKSEMQSSSPAGNLIMSLTTDLLTSQLEKADTRSCFFIPRTVQIARLPVQPGTHRITVTACDQSGARLNEKTFENVVVKPHGKTFLFYSSFQ